MGRVYAVASGKGGVGKTTTVANLGAGLAEADERVVVVDADLGMPNLGAALGVDGGPTLHDVLAGEAEVAAATHEGAGGVSVVPGSDDVAAFGAADPAGLVAVTTELAEEYDHVLVDTGAGLSHDSVVPLSAADCVVLVSGPGRDARGDTAKTRELAERLRTPVEGVVFARVPPAEAEGFEAEEVEAGRFDGVDVLGVVPETPAVAAGTEAGEPVVVGDPADDAAVAYRRIVRAVTADGADVDGAEAGETAGGGVDGERDESGDELDRFDGETDRSDGETATDDDGIRADEADADTDGRKGADGDEDSADDGGAEDAVAESKPLVAEAEAKANGDESEGGGRGEADENAEPGESDDAEGDKETDAEEPDTAGHPSDSPGVNETALGGAAEGSTGGDDGATSEKKGFIRRLLGL